MDTRTVKVNNQPCQECTGHGFVRVPYHLAGEEVWVECDACKAKGVVPKETWITSPQTK